MGTRIFKNGSHFQSCLSVVSLTDMVLMTNMMETFKRGDLENYNDDESGHETSRLKKKKPEKLELKTTTVPAADNLMCTKISDSGCGTGNDDKILVNDSTEKLHAAATRLQKFYKSYRTRRNLADCAVVVEELWWKALEFAALRRSSVSFFNANKSETAVSRWARARTRAAKVGKGLSKDVKGQQLALRHWLEAIDPRHRYGHNLHFYYNVWFESGSCQPFFYWLDVGDGKAVTLDKCSRADLQRQCIKYLGPKEREAYEVILEKGKLIYKQNKAPVSTREGSKWIFVLSTSRILYVAEKVKGLFQHSSFLAGGATVASGRLVVRHGTLHAIWAYSGHYRPTEENFMELCSFLEEHHVDLTNVTKNPIDEDIPWKDKIQKELKVAAEISEDNAIHGKEKSIDTGKVKETVRYKWSTGVGPRIGCVRDYPARLQFKALEHVNLSPRLVVKPCGPIPSPRPSPNHLLSPRLAYLGLVSPRVRLSATN
ncbi:hypothetical protein Goshw_027383 [Gossypium schwendimanii]|uniref:Calmodulin-binding family protein n=1 Tax=Gossypium schwendimanii TaxID=34291 RepID=A0A7J9MQW5_GOSSC|nr:hypothetical protein [Gossypium schwendimanii]